MSEKAPSYGTDKKGNEITEIASDTEFLDAMSRNKLTLEDVAGGLGQYVDDINGNVLITKVRNPVKIKRIAGYIKDSQQREMLSPLKAQEMAEASDANQTLRIKSSAELEVLRESGQATSTLQALGNLAASGSGASYTTERPGDKKFSQLNTDVYAGTWGARADEKIAGLAFDQQMAQQLLAEKQDYTPKAA